MICVRREDRESEWITFLAGERETVYGLSCQPQPWPLHEAVARVNEWRQESYPVAVFAIDEGDRKENPPRQVYPSEEMQRVNA